MDPLISNTPLSRLKESKDNSSLFIVSLDLVAKQYQVIMTVEKLPYDVLHLTPCPNAIGGVIVVSANSIIHVDQASKVTATSSNGWAKRVTDVVLSNEDPDLDIHLEGSQSAFISDTQMLLVLADGSIRIVDLEHEGRLVRRIGFGASLGVTSPPTAILVNDGIVFIASTSYRSVLLGIQPLIMNSASPGISATTGTPMDLGSCLCIQFTLVLLIMAEVYPRDEAQVSPSHVRTKNVHFQPLDALEDPGHFTSACFCITPVREEGYEHSLR